MSPETFKRDLQRMITEEAQSSAKKGAPPDFVAVFNLFDEDGGGTINNEEFRKMLFRLHLIENMPESQVPSIIGMFDTQKKGYINVDDFLKFVSANKSLVKQEIEDEDDGNDDLPGFSSNTPPVAITRNADCDWLSWFLWREACRMEPLDPEPMVYELEAKCREADLTTSQGKSGSVSVKELWNILTEVKMRGGMAKAQYEKSIAYVLEKRTTSKGASEVKAAAKEDDLVDYEALCRYVIRMGRGYNAMIQERKKEDAEKFEGMREKLINALKVMVEEALNR